ncbi:histidinol-phosphate phosphatase [Arthrobacter nitrophenolicus]|uniref:Histidinol-phosphate phosphatase n=1 Tax=Arthrobacter nitrophenolicus TaxID=683150 RepID=L8TTX1_9MICC|nr:histidinol-phosphate phosphatase [Arthrobacter nitrophenolicus]
MPGAKAVLDGLRAEGIATGVISNQSGIARGLITEADVAGVNARVEELLGPFDVWEVCPHSEQDAAPAGSRSPEWSTAPAESWASPNPRQHSLATSGRMSEPRRLPEQQACWFPPR